MRNLGQRKASLRLGDGSGYGEPEEEAGDDDEDDDKSSTRLTQSDLDGFSSAEEESLIAEEEVRNAPRAGAAFPSLVPRVLLA